MKMQRIKMTAEREDLIPQYSRYGDAGADLRAKEAVTIDPGERALVHTGVRLELPDGLMAMVTPRSGLALREGLTVLNSPGIIDSGYRGEVGVILHNTSDGYVPIKAGDRIAQLVITEYITGAFEVAMELSDSERGTGGFGSTGSN